MKSENKCEFVSSCCAQVFIITLPLRWWIYVFVCKFDIKHCVLDSVDGTLKNMRRFMFYSKLSKKPTTTKQREHNKDTRTHSCWMLERCSNAENIWLHNKLISGLTYIWIYETYIGWDLDNNFESTIQIKSNETWIFLCFLFWSFFSFFIWLKQCLSFIFNS